MSTVAFHQTLTELLLYLSRCAVTDSDKTFAVVAGLKLEEKDLDDMSLLNASSTLHSIPEIVGFTDQGAVKHSLVNESLKKQGARWALHVLEAPYAWCLSAAYICGTVISGHALFLSVAQLSKYLHRVSLCLQLS